MRHSLRLAILVPALGLLLPAVAISQNTKAPDDTATMKARYLGGTTVTGKLTKVDGEADPKKLTVQVSWQSKVIDDAGKKKYDDAVKSYQQAVQQKNKGNIQKFSQAAQQAQAGIYKMETHTLDLDFVCDKNTSVRKQASPPKDAATFKDLEADLTVKVTLDKIKANKLKKEDLDAGYPINAILIVPTTDKAAAKTN